MIQIEGQYEDEGIRIEKVGSDMIDLSLVIVAGDMVEISDPIRLGPDQREALIKALEALR